MTARVPPQNLDIERALIGAILTDSTVIPEVLSEVSAPDIYSPSHRRIFEAIIALWNDQQPIDLLTVSNSIGPDISAADLAAMTEDALPSHAEAYAQIIKQAAQKRKILTAAQQAEERIFNADDPLAIAAALASELAHIENGREVPFTDRAAVSRRLSEVQREEVTWLWAGRIPKGKLSLIEGDPGLGKSWLTLAIAAAISQGWPLPGDGKRDPASVILMSAEDGPADTIRPRLEDMDADLERVILLEAVRDQGKDRAITLADLDIIETAITEHQPGLVIVDPLVAYTAGRDTHVASEVRSLLAPLAALAEKHRVAVIAVRHLTKTSGVKAAYRGQGSIDFLASCRSAFLVAEHPDREGERVFAHVKCNLAPKAPSLSFSIEAGRFLWGGESDFDADQLLALTPQGEEKTATDEAAIWLEDFLTEGAQKAKDAQRQGRSLGYTDKQIRMARQKLGIKVKKVGFQGEWFWELPRQRCPDSPKVPKDDYGENRASLDLEGTFGDEKDVWEKVK